MQIKRNAYLVAGFFASRVDDVQAVARALDHASSSVVVVDIIVDAADVTQWVERGERRVEVRRVDRVPREIRSRHLDSEQAVCGVIEPRRFKPCAFTHGAYELVRRLGCFAKVPSGDVQKCIHA